MTFGRYINADSPVHRVDPRAKLALLLATSIVVISSKGIIVNILFLLLFFLLSSCAKIGLKQSARTLFGFSFFFLLTILFHLIFTKKGAIIDFWIFHLGFTGFVRGIIYSVRLANLVLASTVFILTTSPVELADGVENLLSPLTRLGLPVRDFSLMLMIAMRFIPTMLEDGRRIYNAQLCRGAHFHGGMAERAGMLPSVIVPLIVMSFHHAETLAYAIAARGYRTFGERTHLYRLSFGRLDILAVALSITFIILTM